MPEPVTALLDCYGMHSKVSREAIGSRLRVTREALGFGMTAFAAKCGLSRTRYQNFEAGRNLMKPEQAARLLEAFSEEGLDFNWLYSGNMSSLSPRLARAIYVRAERLAQSNAGVVNE